MPPRSRCSLRYRVCPSGAVTLVVAVASRVGRLLLAASSSAWPVASGNRRRSDEAEEVTKRPATTPSGGRPAAAPDEKAQGVAYALSGDYPGGRRAFRQGHPQEAQGRRACT